MRALIISPYFPPQNAVASLRAHSFARALADSGATVTVLTVAKRPDQRGLALPCDGMEIIELEYRVPRVFERLRRQYKAGDGAPHAGAGQVNGGADRAVVTQSRATSRRTPLSAARRLRDRRGIYSSVRMPDLTDYWVKPAVRWCRGHGPWDIIVSSSGPYTAHLAAMAIRREGLASRWIADFRDLWMDNHVYRGLFPFTMREQSLERRCLATADLVTTVSRGLQRTLERKGAEHVAVIYNGFDPAARDGLAAQRIFPDDGLVRLVYTGALYTPGQDPKPLFEALSMLRREHSSAAARLRITVAGHGSEQWIAIARRHGVEDLVEDCGQVTRDDALRMQRDADAMLMIDWACPNEGVLTGKLFEYVSATAPIIAVGGSAESPIAEAVTRSRRGCHLGKDPQRIMVSLLALCEDPASMRLETDVAFVSTFSRGNQARRFVECAVELVG